MNQDVSRSDPRSSYSQSERLVQIGSYLQQVREEQGLLVDQVAGKTMISGRHIRAIEVGDLNALPEAIYVRGFIKRYAEVLGLDGSEISKAFPLHSDGSATLSPTWQNSDVAQLRQTHLYLAYVALITLAVIGLGAVLVRLDNGDRPGQPDPTLATPELEPSESNSSTDPSDATDLPDVAEDPDAAETSQNSSSPSTEADSSEPPDLATLLDPSNPRNNQSGDLDPALADKPVRVELEMKERSWLRVTVDGQLDFEGVLSEGTQRTWAGEDNVLVRVGNAGGVLAAFNGADAEVMGESGSVQEQLFSTNATEPSESSDLE